MKLRAFLLFFTVILTFSFLQTATAADQTLAQSVQVLDEKVNRLSSQMEDLQFRNQQLQKELDKAQAELQDLRRSSGGASANELKALDDRITALDAARQKDRQIIIDQVAKELAAISSGKPPTRPTTPSGPVAGDTKDHVVQKGENLTAIAKQNGVSVVDLRKANGLTSDEIKVGQKLIIPK